MPKDKTIEIWGGVTVLPSNAVMLDINFAERIPDASRRWLAVALRDLAERIEEEAR